MTLLDFEVWDNDTLYTIITMVSIAFALAVIIVVLKQTKASNAAARKKPDPASSKSTHKERVN